MLKDVGELAWPAPGDRGQRQSGKRRPENRALPLGWGRGGPVHHHAGHTSSISRGPEGEQDSVGGETQLLVPEPGRVTHKSLSFFDIQGSLLGGEFTFENSWIVFKCPTFPSVREQGCSEKRSIISGHAAYPWQSWAANTGSRVLAACALSLLPVPSESGEAGPGSRCSPPIPPPPYAFPGESGQLCWSYCPP